MHSDDDFNHIQQFTTSHLQINGTPLKDSQKIESQTTSSSAQDLTAADGDVYSSNDYSEGTAISSANPM